MSSLPDQVAQLDDRRNAFIEMLDGLPREQRTLKAGPEKWSASEITEHVYKSELGFLQWLEKQSAPGNTPRIIGRPSRVKFVGLMFALRSSVKFKVPPGAASASPVGMPYDDIHADWIGFTERWLTIVESIPAELKRKGLARHPIIGPMTVSQSVQFLTAHAARHYRQLERLIESLFQ